VNVTAYGFQIVVARRVVGYVWSVYPLETGDAVAYGRAWTEAAAIRAAFRAVKERQ
jgi:hypothetical protein